MGCEFHQIHRGGLHWTWPRDINGSKQDWRDTIETTLKQNHYYLFDQIAESQLTKEELSIDTLPFTRTTRYNQEYLLAIGFCNDSVVVGISDKQTGEPFFVTFDLLSWEQNSGQEKMFFGKTPGCIPHHLDQLFWGNHPHFELLKKDPEGWCIL